MWGQAFLIVVIGVWDDEFFSIFLARISRITLFLLDRIYWIFRILLFSQFPDGIEKDNPPIGGKN
jgi:hypothetical protein